MSDSVFVELFSPVPGAIWYLLNLMGSRDNSMYLL